MLIQITPDGYLTLSKDVPTVGVIYSLENAATGTLAQGKAFHALIQEYWRSGAHSYDAKTFADFRNMIKRDLGAGFEAYVYIDGGKLVDAKKYEEIPETIRRDPRRREIIRGRLKSWADYTKTERREALDRLIAEMTQSGVNSAKFNQILEGMGANT